MDKKEKERQERQESIKRNGIDMTNALSDKEVELNKNQVISAICSYQ